MKPSPGSHSAWNLLAEVFDIGILILAPGTLGGRKFSGELDLFDARKWGKCSNGTTDNNSKKVSSSSRESDPSPGNILPLCAARECVVPCIGVRANEKRRMHDSFSVCIYGCLFHRCRIYCRGNACFWNKGILFLCMPVVDFIWLVLPRLPNAESFPCKKMKHLCLFFWS